MGHPLLRPMAIILGLMNGAAMIGAATFVLFAQEVMGVGPLLFTVIGFGGAVGGVIGGYVAPMVSNRLGSGSSLSLAIGGFAVTSFLIGAIAWWPAALSCSVSRHSSPPCGTSSRSAFARRSSPRNSSVRVNSVYRFFAWGMSPIGAAMGGVIVIVVEGLANRDLALRTTWFACAVVNLGLFVFGRSKLTTDRIETARAAATRSVS